MWRNARWIPGVAFGALWWWVLVRLAFSPDAGAFEGAVAAGGWGLSLLPVHCVPKSRAAGAAGPVRPGGAFAGATKRWVRAGGGRLTRAWRRRRSGGGSDPS
ncbi:hypothetical protein [Streptomyces sp. NPDC048641]|uniref:hypothetical protein n=1 Tax=Streptomyces sp. NPDC048641 TaxID=3154825 RepID=UPI003414DD2B